MQGLECRSKAVQADLNRLFYYLVEECRQVTDRKLSGGKWTFSLAASQFRARRRGLVNCCSTYVDFHTLKYTLGVKCRSRCPKSSQNTSDAYLIK